jgi:hypothetical protein
MLPSQTIRLLSHELVTAVATRPGEGTAQQRARETAALTAIEAFQPEDGMEVMIAGLAMSFQYLIADAIEDSRGAGNAEKARRHTTQLARAHMGYLRELRLHRAKRAAAAVEPQASGKTPPMPRAPKPETLTVEGPASEPPPPEKPGPETAKPAVSVKRSVLLTSTAVSAISATGLPVMPGKGRKPPAPPIPPPFQVMGATGAV